MKTAIEFKNVTKTYSNSRGKYGLLVETLSNLFDLKKQKDAQQIIALKNTSFTIKEGEAVGIIGKNGAGKSTLLKLISKIVYPDQGKISVHGKIGAFIELGAGLHYELTGRENIYLYGAILGMKKKQIDEKFSEIVEFAGIQKFLDIPIKKYSSGMYSRLGFSVCAFCDPDILLVDEVLAVGDYNFQKKCLSKMHSFAKKKTVVFVSHNLDAIKSICSKVIYLRDGRIQMYSDTSKTIKKYILDSKTDTSS